MAIINHVCRHVSGAVLPAGGTPSFVTIESAQRTVSIFNSGFAPSVAKGAFVGQIRALWDAHPALEAMASGLITAFAAVSQGTGNKADALLNTGGTGKFTARQLLKYLSWDLAFLISVTGSDADVIDTSLHHLQKSGSLSTWLNASNGYDRKNIVAHVVKHYNGPLIMPVTAHATSADQTTQLATQLTKENNTMIFADAPTITVDARMEPAVNAVLTSAGVPTNIAALLSAMARVTAAEQTAVVSAAKTAELTKALAEQVDENSALQRKVKQAQSVSTNYTVPASSAGVPVGSCAMVMASTIFPILKGVDFEIPAWTWAHQHPDVPATNDSYIFRKEMLVKFLLSLKRGDNTWFQGHTGSGKTTFVEQVAARLQWPVARIAFDSAIDRSELVGRMQLKSDGKGGTVSEWLKGVLELAIPNGYILLCDEFDAGRPDALYVLQEVLEHKAKRLLEDGGRFIDYHPMTRIVATGNTCGSGDPSGIYPATRILSGATLDRFPSFIQVPYMTEKEESDLIASATSLSSGLIKRMSKFSTEMRHAFVKAEIPISYSPRRSVAFARAVEDYLAILGKAEEDKAMSLALQQTVYDASPDEFRQRIVEIARSSLGGQVNPTVSL